MKFLFIILFTLSSFAFDNIVECNGEKPGLIRMSKAPETGPYIKVPPYHVTAGKFDPFTEEIFYFLITYKLNKINPQIGTANNYIEFHNFFLKQMDLILKKNENNPGFVISEKELFPIIKQFLQSKNWISSNQEEFNQLIEVNRQKATEIKNIFAIKANTSYYKIVPEDAEIKIEESDKLPSVLLKANGQAIRTTVVSNKLTLFQNQQEEQDEKKNRIAASQAEISYIESVLPTKGSPLKVFLKSIL